jgi:hypothetical protein
MYYGKILGFVAKYWVFRGWPMHNPLGDGSESADEGVVPYVHEPSGTAGSLWRSE